MRRYANRVTVIFTVVLTLFYLYSVARLGVDRWYFKLLLGLPFITIWLMPILYWIGERSKDELMDQIIHVGAYVSMGWLSFLIVLLIGRDLLLLMTELTGWYVYTPWIYDYGPVTILVLSFLALVLGYLSARKGPIIREINIPHKGLVRDLLGFKIAQISDLHFGPTIKRKYAESVVNLTKQLQPNIIVLTGDIVDGSVQSLKEDIAPLAELSQIAPTFLVLGNHDYYAGSVEWTAHFEKLGMKVLLNSNVILPVGAAQLLIGGVVDPAVKMVDPLGFPDPQKAISNPAPRISTDFNLLLAHNPKFAADGNAAGFHLQLSGHTHGGQFIPWTYVVRKVHFPHFAGLSREGNMWVYVSAGTGTWGPPIRMGTSPELTLITLGPSA